MPNSQARTRWIESVPAYGPAGIVAHTRPATPPSVRVTESRGGRIVVRHEDGYVFVFQVHDLDGLVMNLEQVTWSAIGAPPDADDLEQQARTAAEAEALARGWLA